MQRKHLLACSLLSLALTATSAFSQTPSANDITAGGNYTSNELSGIKLGEKNLKGTIFSSAKLKQADLHKADLTGAIFTGADLTGADLTGAILETATVQGADLTDAKLTDANLTNTIYDMNTKWGQGFVPEDHGAILVAYGQDLSKKDWSGKNLTGAVLSNAKLVDMKLNKANLTRAIFIGSDLSGADLAGATMTTATLQGANLKTAILTDADLTTAVYDAKTQWPDGYDPKEHGALLIETPEPAPAEPAAQ